jgi:hypothetical protein
MDDQDRLGRIEDKIGDISGHLASVDITLAKQSVILDEHVKRSNLLEAKMVPLEKHSAMVSGALKLFGFLAILFELYKALK